ncbi:MAG: thioredoxin domain-containing protein [Rhodospirillaceae bacterium]|nr:thioredoxin domain-containing protein [Rhodospirillaceae bacterium]
MAKNRLANETSPYLLQHADNHVDWYPWGEIALNIARENDRPILLSIGYAACHWCHVMAHESFEDPDTAILMNKLFINIKVDREERPDIDNIYMTSLALFGEQGGWPLTMFCTPEGKPFWGGTYFPPTSRYGRPGFPELLHHVANIYHQEPEKVSQNSNSVVKALEDLSSPARGSIIEPDNVFKAARSIIEQIDYQNGGIGTAPKFPQCPVLNLLWRGYKQNNRKDLGDAVLLTLNKMAQGGIYDHLGGGFARYSTDPSWLVPHFEKMLYDNAQLIELYSDAHQDTKEPLYLERVTEIIDWVSREMVKATNPSGGFYSTIDADSEGEEGKFYVWSESEIRHLLGNDANTFIATYDIRTDGNWEGKNILNRSGDPILKTIDIENQLLQNRKTLFNYRKKRIAPALDDKILADWNGLMISALVRASQVFEKPNWLRKAEKAFNFVVTNMCHSGDEKLRLLHSYRLDIAKHLATLDDYANMSRAGLLLFESTNNYEYLDNVKCWIKVLDKFYWDEDLGGYYFTSQDAEDVIVRTKTCLDNATPSGNGIIAEVLARLYYLTGHDYYRKRCESVITAFSAEAEKNPYGHVTLINAAQFLIEAVQIIIIGDMDDEDTKELLAAQNLFNIPTRVLSIIPDGEALYPEHPAFGKTKINENATAYVCYGQVCSVPLENAETLKRHLES